ncbi:unnamed protein product [Kluyveromyces dobzhanskii CBS 2104]|uniref:WGS project CCBQ000000000 data, contig 00015 n=1 Tax=Kluyveromyces dobzhanskii CBS 2104 TaxID=1427455 RepID=A0A0A8LAP6_9SACH|nr:unnamed protein product [Kluyveromyces dobzhanskii CBS 2104]
MRGPLLVCQEKDRVLLKLASSSLNNDAVLSVSTHETEISVLSNAEFPARGNIMKVAALIGVVKLKFGKYVIIANRVEEAGRLNGHNIFKVAEHTIISVDKKQRLDSDESQYLELLEQHLSSSTLFYSYGYDLTNSTQRNEELEPSSASWEQADARFFWNSYVTESLQKIAKTDDRVSDFIVPMIYGYVKVIDTVFHATPISIGLITRRSIFRAGTRYFRRGIDEHGNVGNFNETEQILCVQKPMKDGYHFFSFLQTRGSVPVYWAELNNLKYKPNLLLAENSSLDATKKHFEEQTRLYNENYLVNLVNQKGHELPVKQAYEQVVTALNNPKLHYIYFDFHHECRNMQWHKVKLLLDHLQEMGLSNKDFFHKTLDANGATLQVISKQQSTVRTNCMDCLDRTNVVQSVLAHWVLQEEFKTVGLSDDSSVWEADKKLLFEFQNFWADNADAVSVAYSGTGALKTDFTRTGNRTYLGALRDGINSISRYYQNNLTDGPREDAFDLFLGNFRPYASVVHSPFPDRRPMIIQAVPTLIYAALTVMVATILFPKNHFTSTKNLSFFFGSLGVVVFCTRFVLKEGIQYVNWPKLVDLGFLVAEHTHNKEKQFKGVRYIPDPKFVKPNSFKRD